MSDNNDKKNRMKKFWKPLLWAIIILILSGIPGQVVEPYVFWNADKLVHTVIYFGLTMFLLAAFNKLPSLSFFNQKAASIAMFISIFYGGLMEVLQATVFINRSGNLPDFAFNSAGAIVAAMTFSFWMKNGFLRKIIG